MTHNEENIKKQRAALAHSRESSETFTKLHEEKRIHTNVKLSDEDKLRQNARSKGESNYPIDVLEKNGTKEVELANDNKFIEETKKLEEKLDMRLFNAGTLLDAATDALEEGKSTIAVVDYKRLADVYLALFKEKKEMNILLYRNTKPSKNGKAPVSATQVNVNINSKEDSAETIDVVN